MPVKCPISLDDSSVLCSAGTCCLCQLTLRDDLRLAKTKLAEIKKITDNLKALLDKATPGPWSVHKLHGHTIDQIYTTHPDFQQKPHGNYVGETALADGHTAQRFSNDAELICELVNIAPHILELLKDESNE